MKNGSILITGVYLATQENNVRGIIEEFGKSLDWKIVQKWISIGGTCDDLLVRGVTINNVGLPSSKFENLNKVLSAEQLDAYEFIIVSDDDIYVPSGFLDKYMSIVVKRDLALAQPARTHNSYIDHHFVEQLDGLEARRTRFVEIGPLFSVRRDLFPVIFPLDEDAYMGWGCDFVWPCLVESLGKRMGIVDATPIEHSMRKPVKNYAYDDANRAMGKYLAKRHHLSKDEAFRILESYT